MERTLRPLWALFFAAAFATCATSPVAPTFDPGPLQPSSQEVVALDHLLLIVDASGSVHDDSRFDEERALVRAYVASLPDGEYQVGAVAFGGERRRSYPLEPFDRTRFRAYADKIQHLQQGTPIHKVLDEARDSLWTRSGRAAVVIFSDGLVTDEFGQAVDPVAAVTAARELDALYDGEICFHTVQVGTSEQGARELRAISKATRCGSHRAAATIATETQLHAFHREVFLAARAAVPAVASAAGATPGTRSWLINFGVDSSHVDAMYQSQLDEVASQLQRDSKARVRISGHTDASGTAGYNDELSMRRAVATRDELIRSGVEAGRIELHGYGLSAPLRPNDDDENRSANRRTEIQLVR